jgi:hypothetical protein
MYRRRTTLRPASTSPIVTLIAAMPSINSAAGEVPPCPARAPFPVAGGPGATGSTTIGVGVDVGATVGVAVTDTVGVAVGGATVAVAVAVADTVGVAVPVATVAVGVAAAVAVNVTAAAIGKPAIAPAVTAAAPLADPIAVAGLMGRAYKPLMVMTSTVAVPPAVTPTVITLALACVTVFAVMSAPPPVIVGSAALVFQAHPVGAVMVKVFAPTLISVAAPSVSTMLLTLVYTPEPLAPFVAMLAVAVPTVVMAEFA